MQQGLVLLVVGITTVFSFLVLLMISMQLSAAFFRKFAHWFPEEINISVPSPDPIAEIAVAIAAIRAKRG